MGLTLVWKLVCSMPVPRACKFDSVHALAACLQLRCFQRAIFQAIGVEAHPNIDANASDRCSCQCQADLTRTPEVPKLQLPSKVAAAMTLRVHASRLRINSATPTSPGPSPGRASGPPDSEPPPS